MKKYILTISWLISIWQLAICQIPPLPLVKNFRPSEYQAGRSNWAIVQDQRGIIYIGNESSILEYDGITWRKINLPNKSYVRSLDIDEEGRIWVGGVGDFGYLQPDSIGEMQFVSLLDKFDDKYHEFKDVWETYCTKDGVYFQSFARLFRYDKESGTRIWEPKSSYHFSFNVNDRFFIREWDLGLMEMLDDSLELVSEGSRFSNERVYVMLPFDADQILVGTRAQGLFLYNGVTFSEFPTEIDPILKAAQLYHPGIVLSNDRFGLGTLNEGVLIFNKQGQLVQKIDKIAGLPDNTITYIFEDKRGVLWLTRDNGISRAEINSPFTLYDGRLGLEGRAETIIHHKDKIYIGSTSGAFVLDNNTAYLKKINGINAQTWSFLEIGNQLLCATSDGLYQIDGYKASIIRESISQDFYAVDLMPSQQDPDILFVGLSTGFSILIKRNGKWRSLSSLK